MATQDKSPRDMVGGPDDFKILLNVNHYGEYKPEEIYVHIVDKWIVVAGKREWQPHPGSLARKEFRHRLDLPDDVDTERLTAHMSQTGVLLINAPRLGPNPFDLIRRLVNNGILSSSTGSLTLRNSGSAGSGLISYKNALNRRGGKGRVTQVSSEK